MAQLKDTVIEGVLKIQGKDSEGKALILPEESEIYIGNEPFKGGVSSEEIQQMGFVTNNELNQKGYVTATKVGGNELGLVKNGGNVTINPDGTMRAPTSSGGKEYGVGGDELGLVKNGGNVYINTDGTMTAPSYESEGENSFSTNETNIGLGDYSFASGINTISGGKGFKVLSRTGEIGGTGSYTLDSIVGLEIGDQYSIRLQNNYDYIGTIESISTDTDIITVTNYIDEEIDSSREVILWIPEKPTIGTTKLGQGSHTEGYGTRALCYGSHAEGCNTEAGGRYSHAEGNSTKAGYSAHAEGGETFAQGVYSHAEGNVSQSIGMASHAEGAEWYLYIGEYKQDVGGRTSALGRASHAEGAGTLANADGTHSEGVVTEAGRNYDLNNNNYVEVLIKDALDLGLIENNENPDKRKVAELTRKLIGYGAHSEGIATRALGSSSHAEGNITQALANSTHSEGDSTVAYGEASHAEGHKTRATGNQSHAEGFQTMAIGNASHAEGKESKANGYTAHAEGLNTKANGLASHSEGTETIAASQNQHAQGKFNIIDNSEKYAHIVGNGENNTNSSNAHTLDWNGNAWYQGSMTSNGADYSEFFEWQDGNADNEDRVGLLVALDGEKIRLANSGDEILGIISGTAAVLGDNYECEWNGKYLTDDFGRVIYDLVEEFIDEEHIEFKEVEKEIIDEETNETKTVTELEEVITTEKKSIGFWKHPRLNPDYDPEQAYINRSDRPEWDVVGMLGKLYVRDDGTCIPNYYATIGENGIATSSLEKTNIRILSRINSNVVRVLLK